MVMYSLLLNAGPKEGGPSTMITLISIIVLALILWGICSLLGKLMNKSKKATQAMLIFNMNKYGPDSLSTIATVTSLVKQMFKDEGIKKADVDLVYEIGNRYQGTVTFDGNTYDITVIADRTGGIQYKINGVL